MDDRFNTIAGWTLFAGIIALGLTSIFSRVFASHEPEQEGYAIEAAEEEGGEDAGPSLASLLATGDVAAGEKVFAKCTACHTANQGGANGIGPNLYGVMGQPIGQHVAGFAYSSALADHGGNWDFANMDEWLKSPRAFANGTKMSFAGLSSGEDRANIILYLNSLGSNLPLPAVEEEPAAEEGAEEAVEAGDVAGQESAADGGEVVEEPATEMENADAG
jgi:cytochrome c